MALASATPVQTETSSQTHESAAGAFLAALQNSTIGEATKPDEVQPAASGTEATKGHSRVILGENGNPIFTYSTEHVSLDRVLQILNDMTRLSDDTWNRQEMVTMRTALRETLMSTYAILDRKISSTPEEYELANEVAKMLVQSVGYTRDVIDGKKERTLAYLLIAEHYNVCPSLAISMVRHLIQLQRIAEDGTVVEEVGGHQYGSWHDIKRLSAFMRDHYDATVEHPIVVEALDLLASQLQRDMTAMDMYNEPRLSLAARHSPKSTGAAKWLYRPLALRLFPYDKTAKTQSQLEAAGRKAEQHLRQKVLVPLNRLLNTVEVMMSSEESEWHKIDFGKLPSQALRRHVRAWKNQLKDGSERSDKEDRQTCAKNYTQHMARVESGKAKVNGKQCGVAELVYDVLRSVRSSVEDARIAGQWKSKLKTIPEIPKCIAMVDLSGSMCCHLAGSKNISCMDAAIGLGLMVAAKSQAPFNNKVVTFAEEPVICSFEPNMSFASRVRHIRAQRNGISTDFRRACKCILDAALVADVEPSFFKDFILFVLSDMQINSSSMATWNPNLAQEVKEMFWNAGLNSKHAVPFDAPHIVMWNLSSTNAIATSAGLVNATSIAGYSDALLKIFEKEGISGLLKATPIETLRKQLNNERYAPLAKEYENMMANKMSLSTL